MVMKIGIIGNGRIAKECAAILKSYPSTDCTLTRVVIDGSRSNISSDLKKYCEMNGIDHIVSENINDQVTLDYLASGTVDLVFSINNHQIIRGELLRLPAEGIINFHNGPLPRYGGLNACSWAIFNGETRHGVTWHYVTEGVDAGDIIAQKCFDIAPQSTALQLVMLCINEGIGLFREVISNLLQRNITRVAQDPSSRLYYFGRQIPAHGNLHFSWEYERIQRLVRALNYNPLESPLGNAAATINGRKFYVDKVRLVRPETRGVSGQVMRADGALEIQALDAVLEICEVRNEQQKRVPVKDLIEDFAIAEGMRMETEQDNEQYHE